MVRRCVEKSSQVSYAVKIIDLTSSDNSNQVLEAGHNEINLLQTCCTQPNISMYFCKLAHFFYMLILREACLSARPEWLRDTRRIL